AMIV
ncbi:putative secreted calcium-binding domain protein, partial [Vibrio parahaemolyticus VPTS-2010]